MNPDVHALTSVVTATVSSALNAHSNVFTPPPRGAIFCWHTDTDKKPEVGEVSVSCVFVFCLEGGESCFGLISSPPSAALPWSSSCFSSLSSLFASPLSVAYHGEAVNRSGNSMSRSFDGSFVERE